MSHCMQENVYFTASNICCRNKLEKSDSPPVRSAQKRADIYATSRQNKGMLSTV